MNLLGLAGIFKSSYVGGWDGLDCVWGLQIAVAVTTSWKLR